VVEQEATIHVIRMSKGAKSVLVTKQETIVLPRIETTITKVIPMVVKLKYNEPKFNQQNGSIVTVIRDWGRGIHSVNKFQDLILHIVPTTIKLDIRSMNVHLWKIM
jgi:hypothetical protein